MFLINRHVIIFSCGQNQLGLLYHVWGKKTIGNPNPFQLTRRKRVHFPLKLPMIFIQLPCSQVVTSHQLSRHSEIANPRQSDGQTGLQTWPSRLQRKDLYLTDSQPWLSLTIVQDNSKKLLQPLSFVKFWPWKQLLHPIPVAQVLISWNFPDKD